MERSHWTSCVLYRIICRRGLGPVFLVRLPVLLIYLKYWWPRVRPSQPSAPSFVFSKLLFLLLCVFRPDLSPGFGACVSPECFSGLCGRLHIPPS